MSSYRISISAVFRRDVGASSETVIELLGHFLKPTDSILFE